MQQRRHQLVALVPADVRRQGRDLGIDVTRKVHGDEEELWLPQDDDRPLGGPALL